jgi:hypothetical protein
MYIQSVTAQWQYATLQLTGCAGANASTEEATEPNQPQVIGFDRVELSAWAISLSRQAIDESGETPEVTDSTEQDPEAPAELIADLRSTVDALREDGTISERMARHLDRILEHAADSIEQGHQRRATRLLRRFAHHVDRLTDHGVLSEETGASMIETAEDAVHQLRAERHHRHHHRHSEPTPTQTEDDSISFRAGVILLFTDLRTAQAQ